MKRIIICAFLIMPFLFLFVQAEEQVLVDKNWRLPGEEFLLLGEYEIKLYDSNNAEHTGIFVNDNSFIIEKGNCQTSKPFYVCVEDIIPSNEVDERTGKKINQYSIAVYKNTAELNIKRAYLNRPYAIEEEIQVEVTIFNNGTERAKNIVFEDPLKEFVISSIYNCNYKGSTIIWRGALDPGGKHTCSYKLIANKGGNISTQAKLSYFDGVNNSKILSEPFNVSINSFGMYLETALSKERVQVDKPLTYTLTAKNTNLYDDLSHFTLTIEVPERISIIPQTIEERTVDGRITWSDELKRQEEKSYVFLVTPRKEAYNTIYSQMTFKMGGAGRKIISSGTFSSVTRKLQMNYSNFKKKVYEEEEFAILGSVENPSEADYHNINISLQSSIDGLELEQEYIPILKGGESIEVLDYMFVSGRVEEAEHQNINVKMVYEDEFGERYEVRELASFSVLKKEKVIEKVVIEDVENEEIDKEELGKRLEELTEEPVGRREGQVKGLLFGMLILVTVFLLYYTYSSIQEHYFRRKVEGSGKRKEREKKLREFRQKSEKREKEEDRVFGLKERAKRLEKEFEVGKK